MEGIGSRLGRVSSRYGGGSATSAPVFNGPVRKWKRQWVLCQSDNVAGGKGNNHQNPPPLFLCRWTPLPSTNSDESSTNPPKRKFRYTPVSNSTFDILLLFFLTIGFSEGFCSTFPVVCIFLLTDYL